MTMIISPENIIKLRSDFPREYNERLNFILDTYEKFIRKYALEKHVPVNYFPILRPHNIAVLVDSTKIHVVLGLYPLSPGYRDVIMRDFRNKGVIDPSSFVRACKIELG